MKHLTLPPQQLVDLANEVLGRGGHLSFVANGHCMAPTICDGDQVTLGPLPATGPKVGDIALIRTEQGLCLHRLTEIKQGGAGPVFYSRGDAEAKDGEPAPLNSILGMVVGIKRNQPWWKLLIKNLIS